jgi:hypothetical protein
MRQTVRCGLAVVLLTLGAVGCDSADSPGTPLGPTNQPELGPPPPPPTRLLIGHVSDSAFRPLQGARVEVRDGPQAGRSTLTDATGQFSMSGTFDSNTRFSAELDGYVGSTQTWTDCATCHGPYLLFRLGVTAPPVAVAGDYTVTFVADSTCADIPAELRSRTYAATMAPAGPVPGVPPDTSFHLTLNEGTFLDGYRSLSVGVAGDVIAMWFGGDGPFVVEQVDPHTYLGFDGAIEAVVTPPLRSITASFRGYVNYCALDAPMGLSYNCPASRAVARSECESSNHQLIVTRR